MEQWIEAFRVGGAASRGITVDHLNEVVSDDFDANPRALCFGHPKSDDPAAGTLTGAKVEGNSLMVRLGSMTQKAIDGIKSGEWLNRSAAFFDPTHEANPRPGKWTLRHVGLLGGAAPGIPNMPPLAKAMSFAAGDETLTGLEITGDPADAVVYAGAPTPVHTIFDAKEPKMADTPDKDAEFAAREADLATREAAAKAREDAAAARIKTQFDAANGSAIDALVTAGKVTPAEAPGLKLAFAALDPEGDELTFGAGDTATKSTAAAHLLAFMGGLPKRVPVGEKLSPSTTFSADVKDQSAFDAKVKTLTDGGLDFEAACARVEAEIAAA